MVLVIEVSARQLVRACFAFSCVLMSNERALKSIVRGEGGVGVTHQHSTHC